MNSRTKQYQNMTEIKKQTKLKMVLRFLQESPSAEGNKASDLMNGEKNIRENMGRKKAQLGEPTATTLYRT